MFSSIIKENLNSQKDEVNNIQKTLNQIYEMLTSKKEKEGIKIFENFIEDKIKLKNIPQSLNSTGTLIMTFSKFWMIMILISLSQLKNKDEKIKNLIYLVNISLYYDLNEKEEYKDFYDNLCGKYIDDKIALKSINLNPYLENKLNNINDHLEIKKHYMYLLNKPHYFEKYFDFESKLKSKEHRDNVKIEDKKILETVNSVKKLSKKFLDKRKYNEKGKNKIELNESQDEESDTDIETKKSSKNYMNQNKKIKKNKINEKRIPKQYIVDDESEDSDKNTSKSYNNKLGLENKNKKRKYKRKVNRSLSNLNTNIKRKFIEEKKNSKKQQILNVNKNNKRRIRSFTQKDYKLNKIKKKKLKKKESPYSSIIKNDNHSKDKKDFEKETNEILNDINESFIKDLYNNNNSNKSSSKIKMKKNNMSFDDYDENSSFSSFDIDYGKFVDIDSDKIESLLNCSDLNNSYFSK